MENEDEFHSVEDHGPMFNEGQYYDLESIIDAIPMLDEIQYRHLYIQINGNLLTKKEVEEENMKIKRLENNEKMKINTTLAKMMENKRNDPEETTE